MATVRGSFRSAKTFYPPNTILVPEPIRKPRSACKLDKPLAFPPNSLLIQKATKKGIPLPRVDVPTTTYGQCIYLYTNIQTNQTVYSLTRHLNNKDAISQLPYLGKKTIPPALRKDLWSPLAMVYFPSHHAGLAAYRKLREFRRLHETSYDLEDITEKEGKYAGSLYPIKKRGRILMNQKANSIADLAAVLLQQQEGLSEERLERQDRRIERIERLKKQKGAHKVKKDPVDIGKEMGGVEGVRVRWADTSDAEFAETWPEEVVHDILKKSRHDVAWPIMNEPIMGEPGTSEADSTTKITMEVPKGIWNRVASLIPGRSKGTAVATT